MIRKLLAQTLIVGTLYSGSAALLPAPKANALVLAVLEHHPHQKDKLCICGILCLFLCFPVGIILDIKSLVNDFDKKLPFLANSLEGMLLKSEITRLARVVKVKKEKIKIDKKELAKVNNENPAQALSKSEIRKKVRLVESTQGVRHGGIVLNEGVVRDILSHGDYTQEEIQKAVTVLCH